MTVDAEVLKRVLTGYHERLQRHREALNRLNVYPVPDGDTGTNMALTVRSVVQAMDGCLTMEEVTRAIAHGSLMGARGNSGVILSQILRGLADTFRARDEMGAAALVEALDRASTAAYQAVLRPVEGTILTVLREAAEAAAETGTGPGEDLADLLRRVYRRAQEALERTPELLPVLKQAGVVDAGGAGFLLLLASFLEEVTGEETDLPESLLRTAAGVVRVREAAGVEVSDLRYEVMFFLAAPDERIESFKERWAGLGDSIVVVGGEGTYNCHIHTDDVGAAIEAALDAGRPSSIRVTDLAEQVGEETLHRAGFEPLPDFVGAGVGVVAVGAGDGVVEMFRRLGAQGIVTGGQTMNPSTQDLLGAVERAPAPRVMLLPNNPNIVAVAEQVPALASKEVVVIPTRSVVEGLAAMVAYLPDGDPEELAERMRRAAGAVHSGEVTRAVRDASTPVGEIREGDWLGIVDGRVSAVAADRGSALIGVMEDLVGEEVELVTILTGEGSDPEDVERLRARLQEIRPDLEVEEAEGGQPVYPYLVSAE